MFHPSFILTACLLGAWTPIPAPLVVDGGEIEASDAFDRSVTDPAGEIAAEKARLVIVFVGAPDSAQANLMRKCGWRDEALLQWAKDHARVLSIDTSPNAPPLPWAIQRVPTTIAFRGGIEIDRITGYRNPSRLLDFLKGAHSGETSDRRFDSALKSIRDGSSTLTPAQRLALARDLLDASRLDDACTQFQWLWDNLATLDASMARVRTGPLVIHLRELCRQHPPSREAFTSKRDALDSLLRDDSTRTWAILADWLALNDALGDDEASLAWFDRLKAHPDSPGTLERFADRLERLLERQGGARGDEVILISTKPHRKLRSEHELAVVAAAAIERDARSEDPTNPLVTDNGHAMERFEHRMARYFCTLLEHARGEQAAEFAQESTLLDPAGSLSLALVREAVDRDIYSDTLHSLLAHATKAPQGTEQLALRLDALKKKNKRPAP